MLDFRDRNRNCFASQNILKSFQIFEPESTVGCVSLERKRSINTGDCETTINDEGFDLLYFKTNITRSLKENKYMQVRENIEESSREKEIIKLRLYYYGVSFRYFTLC